MVEFQRIDLAMQIELDAYEESPDASEVRQQAWKIYARLLTRQSLIGRTEPGGTEDFRGDVVVDCFEDLARFSDIVEDAVCSLPAPGATETKHLSVFLGRMLVIVVRPFLLRWRAPFVHYWSGSDSLLDPFQRQRAFPHRERLKQDWTEVRRFLRSTTTELAKVFALVPDAPIPPELSASQSSELGALEW